MDEKTNGKRLALRPGAFDRLKMNRYKLSQWGRVSYPTVLKYTAAEAMDSFNGEVLYTLLSVGLGRSDEEIESMRLGDLFEVAGDIDA